MKPRQRYLLVCLVAPLLAVVGTMVFIYLPTGGYANTGSSGNCASATLSLDGVMPTSRNLSYSNLQQMSTGFMTKQEFEPFPPALSASLCGSQHFTFTYSPNITDVRIFVAGEELYKGPPISFLDASSKPKGEIRIQFTWSGNSVQIGVSNG